MKKNIKKYIKVLDYYLNRCLKSKSYNEEKHVITEWDVAMDAKTIFGDKFACIDTDKKSGIIMMVINGHWIQDVI